VNIFERRRYTLYSPKANVRRRLYRRSRSNRAFAGLAGMLFIVRLVRQATRKQVEVAALDRLAPGQTMIIRTIEPPTRRQRRAARRRGADSAR
jgi:hypothetical protein